MSARSLLELVFRERLVLFLEMLLEDLFIVPVGPEVPDLIGHQSPDYGLCPCQADIEIKSSHKGFKSTGNDTWCLLLPASYQDEILKADIRRSDSPGEVPVLSPFR